MYKPMVAAVLAFGAFLTVGCSGPTDPSDNQIKTFSKAVNPQDADVNAFNIDNIGEFSVKLTGLTPGNVYIGVAWGQSPDGIACQPIQNNPAVSNTNIGRTVLSGSVYIKGQYCVGVFDPYATLGTPPWPVAQTYTLEVSHP